MGLEKEADRPLEVRPAGLGEALAGLGVRHLVSFLKIKSLRPEIEEPPRVLLEPASILASRGTRLPDILNSGRVQRHGDSDRTRASVDVVRHRRERSIKRCE